MGLAATSARKYMLMARKINIQFQLQQIAQSRMRLLNVLDRVYAAAQTLEPDNPAVILQEQFMSRLQNQDKRITLLQERLKQQMQAIDAEMQALEKILSEDIKKTFGYLG